MGPTFSVKELSKKSGIPRSSFYYHFDDKDEFIDQLLTKHIEVASNIKSDLENIDRLIPELYEILFKYKSALKFHRQLLLNNTTEKYFSLYKELNTEIIKFLLPDIKAYYKFEQDDEEIMAFYSTVTDSWYAQLNMSKLSVEHMILLAEQIMNKVLNMTAYKHW